MVQRVICFEKKTNPQINYKWKQVWDSLFLVIKFVSNSEMFRNPEIVQIATEVRDDERALLPFCDLTCVSTILDYNHLQSFYYVR